MARGRPGNHTSGFLLDTSPGARAALRSGQHTPAPARYPYPSLGGGSAVLYLFAGNSARTYPQYLDTATGLPLQAVPGGSYSMAPVPGTAGLPVPPGDGLWRSPAPEPATTKTSAKGAPAARKGA